MNNNIDLDEVLVSDAAAWLTLAGILLVCLGITLGVIKVRNELDMTEAYQRQAVALERIADSLEGSK